MPAGINPTWLYDAILALVGVLLLVVGWQYRNWYNTLAERFETMHADYHACVSKVEGDVLKLSAAHYNMRNSFGTELNGHMLDIKTRLVRIETKLEDVPRMREDLHDVTSRVNRLEARHAAEDRN